MQRGDGKNSPGFERKVERLVETWRNSIKEKAKEQLKKSDHYPEHFQRVCTWHPRKLTASLWSFYQNIERFLLKVS